MAETTRLFDARRSFWEKVFLQELDNADSHAVDAARSADYAVNEWDLRWTTEPGRREEEP